jgi:hypothetical protein
MSEYVVVPAFGGYDVLCDGILAEPTRWVTEEAALERALELANAELEALSARVERLEQVEQAAREHWQRSTVATYNEIGKALKELDALTPPFFIEQPDTGDAG